MKKIGGLLTGCEFVALLLVLGVIGTILFLGYQLRNFTIAGGWGEELHHEARSPDGKYVAAVFIGSSGATTGYSTHVHLTTAPRGFNREYEGDDAEGRVASFDGYGRVGLQWKTPTHLIIVGPLSDPGAVFQKETRWDRVTISYSSNSPEKPQRFDFKALRGRSTGQASLPEIASIIGCRQPSLLPERQN